MSSKLKSLGLVETTSSTQKKNGTIRFHDPIANCDYMSYESGYIRREYSTKSSWGSNRAIYQLNPQKKAKRIWNEIEYNVTERILIHNPNYRLELLTRAVANYRKYINK